MAPPYDAEPGAWRQRDRAWLPVPVDRDEQPGARVEHPPEPGPGYLALDEESQVEVLRRVALAAAEAFGVGVRDLTLVLHAYNTTFRVDSDDGRRLALRVNTNSKSTPAHIAAQQAWLHALASETDVVVPAPRGRPGRAVGRRRREPGVGRAAARDPGVVARGR